MHTWSTLPSPVRRWTLTLVSLLFATLAVLALMSLTSVASDLARDTAKEQAERGVEPLAPAAPIPPPEGYPKFLLSSKTVTPVLAASGGATLTYVIELRNTGATTASNASMVDPLPTDVTYLGDARASHGSPPALVGSDLVWSGEVGFDSAVLITFGVRVDPAFSGTLRNTAVISDPLIAEPVSVSAESMVTDDPVLVIGKSAEPSRPGPNGPLTYTLRVTNTGQPATSLPVTVTDLLPDDTVLRGVGADGSSVTAETLQWTRHVTLDLGETSTFSFWVEIGNVLSGTIIANEAYSVAAPFGVTSGEPYTFTVVDPIFALSKRVWPDPPGSNREMTFTLTVLNIGSLAQDVTISDRVPAGVAYVSGGQESAGVVTWQLDELDTGESARLTYTVFVSDVMNIAVENADYGVCDGNGICAPGDPVTSVVEGPVFEVHAFVDPIAHKPGGGTGTEVTPTLILRNVGAGNALDAQATLVFTRLSVQASDLYAVPAIGTPAPFPPGSYCGNKCKSYVWVGDLMHGQAVTFTTFEGQSTIGGDEGTHYTATIIVTDVLSNKTTEPFSATAVGTVTHLANVEPIKSAPDIIGAGQLLTYTIEVFNRGMTTELPPILTDVVPVSTTLVWASDGGVSATLSDTLLVSWTLPLLSPGEGVVRRFSVRVDEELISGTKIVNSNYAAFGYGNVTTGTLPGGPPVTTTVKEAGLIHSFKTVTPQISMPGPAVVLTYEVHLVNSGPLSLTGVTAYDLLPWAASTYRRNAVASAGDLVSDIISLDWRGDIGPFAEVVLTASVAVDPNFEGVLTNTVVISHPDLKAPVVRHARAYVTSKPVLFIRKTATPSPVGLGKRLTYRLYVTNMGQQATGLVMTDVLPANVAFADATAGGKRVGDLIRWQWPVQAPGEQVQASFRVTVTSGRRVVNEHYGVRSAEGVGALGVPLITPIKGGAVYLPIVLLNAQ